MIRVALAILCCIHLCVLCTLVGSKHRCSLRLCCGSLRCRNRGSYYVACSVHALVVDAHIEVMDLVAARRGC